MSERGKPSGPPNPADADARETLQRFEDLAELAPVPLFVANPDGGRTWVNREWTRIAETDFKDAMGTKWSSVIHPDDVDRVLDEWRAATSAGREFRLDYRYVVKSGALKWISAKAVPLRDASGRITAYLGVAIEVTERRLAEALLVQRADELSRANADLARRDEEMRLLFEKTHDAVITMDAAGHIHSWNPRAAEVFGWTAQEAVGRKVSDLIIPESLRSKHNEGLKQFLATRMGPVLNKAVDMPALRKDGSEIPIELVIVPTQVKDSWLFTGFARDISLRKAAEEELSKAHEAAISASRTKSEFLANVSHEIRTPMNGILGMTELALGTNLTAEQREYLETVKKSAKGLLAILNSVLDFSKIEAGKLEVDRLPFRVRGIIEDTVKLHSFRAHEKGLRLLWVAAPDVPERISGDPLRLGQVLGNMVANAVKFTDHGEVEVRVARMPAAEGEPRLHFVIRDTGIGIPKDKLGTIFEAFTQADASTTRRFGGTGLGLAISEKLVSLMGGRIWVESELGKGSTFHFTIRLHDAKTSVHEPVPLAPGALPTRKLRVLVAEDNPVNQRLAALILQRRGHEAVVASDGHVALATLRKQEFDAILMDVQMPDLDGVATTAAIRRGEAGEKAKGVPIVAMTAHAMPGDRERFLEAGMSVYISKPVDARELVEAVEASAAAGAPVTRAFAAG